MLFRTALLPFLSLSLVWGMAAVVLFGFLAKITIIFEVSFLDYGIFKFPVGSLRLGAGHAQGRPGEAR